MMFIFQYTTQRSKLHSFYDIQIGKYISKYFMCIITETAIIAFIENSVKVFSFPIQEIVQYATVQKYSDKTAI